MRTRVLFGWLVSACLLLAGSAAAQEIVHALSGSVVKVDSQAKTILLNTDDGSGGQFDIVANPDAPLNFNRDIRAQSTPAGKFDKADGQVVVFYYGNNAVRTAVALQDLGPGPFVKLQGTVTKVNKHDHEITIKDAAGKSETLHTDAKAIADTPDGVVQADRFVPDKGDNISVVATSANGVDTIVFLHD